MEGMQDKEGGGGGGGSEVFFMFFGNNRYSFINVNDQSPLIVFVFLS